MDRRRSAVDHGKVSQDRSLIRTTLYIVSPALRGSERDPGCIRQITIISSAQTKRSLWFKIGLCGRLAQW